MSPFTPKDDPTRYIPPDQGCDGGERLERKIEEGLRDKIGALYDALEKDVGMIKIRPCECGASQRLKTKGPILERMEIGSAYAVYCRSCGLYGPFANYEDEAIYEWNQMKNKVRR